MTLFSQLGIEYVLDCVCVCVCVWEGGGGGGISTLKYTDVGKGF